MRNLANGSETRSTLRCDILPKLLMESERHINKEIIKLIEDQDGEYVDDFYEIESGTWCLYFTCKHDNIYQLSINTNPRSDEYGVNIYDINLDKILEMTRPESLAILLEDPDVGMRVLLHNS